MNDLTVGWLYVCMYQRWYSDTAIQLTASEIENTYLEVAV